MGVLSPSDKILAVDIGGSHIKTMVLDAGGNPLEERRRLPTPNPSSPEAVVDIIKKLAAQSAGYTKVAVGFPGFVQNNVVKTAPNLGTEAWKDYQLATILQEALGKPTLVVNDADFQGAGLVSGKGLEMVITLGTGFGTALLLDGALLPHLEISQLPVTKSKNYDAYIGQAALEFIGEVRWNERMKKVLQTLRTVFNFNHLYISGGNAELLNFDLGADVSIKSNKDGFVGAVKLWQ